MAHPQDPSSSTELPHPPDLPAHPGGTGPLAPSVALDVTLMGRQQRDLAAGQRRLPARPGERWRGHHQRPRGWLTTMADSHAEASRWGQAAAISSSTVRAHRRSHRRGRSVDWQVQLDAAGRAAWWPRRGGPPALERAIAEPATRAVCGSPETTSEPDTWAASRAPAAPASDWARPPAASPRRAPSKSSDFSVGHCGRWPERVRRAGRWSHRFLRGWSWFRRGSVHEDGTGCRK